MGTFSSLESGEAILGVSTKNPNAGCPKNTDAAGVAGAALVTAGLLATAAATTIGLSMASNGLTAGQSAANETLSNALSGAFSSSDAAAADAQAAVNAGPGSEANAKLQSAQGNVKSAQTDAMKLANEKKAGADSKTADAQAKIASAKQYLSEKTSEANYLTTNGPQMAMDMGKTMGSAALRSAPTPKSPIPPTPAPRPVPAIPIGIPVPAVVVPAVVSKPPEAVAISAPTSPLTDQSKDKLYKKTDSTSTTTTPLAVEENLTQTALSKDATDKCFSERNKLIQKFQVKFFNKVREVFESMEDKRTALKGNGSRKFCEPGGWFSSDRSAFAFVVWVEYGVNETIFAPEIVKDNIEYQDLYAKYLGAIKESKLRDVLRLKSHEKTLSAYINYQAKCEDLPKYQKIVEEAIQAYEGVGSNEKQLLADINDPLWVYGFYFQGLVESEDVIPNVKNFFQWYLGVANAIRKLNEIVKFSV